MAVRGAAFGDLNNDGRLDIVMNCNNRPPMILENQHISQNHWLTVNTMGTTSNRDGIGATLHPTAQSGAEQYAVVSTARQLPSANDRRVHFGLGEDKLVKSLDVDWPSGKKQQSDQHRGGPDSYANRAEVRHLTRWL
jgi:enediyne biosynthesis protein E4